jgi:hypothetical protein
MIARSFASGDGGGAAPTKLTHIKIAIVRIRDSPFAGRAELAFAASRV